MERKTSKFWDVMFFSISTDHIDLSDIDDVPDDDGRYDAWA